MGDRDAKRQRLNTVVGLGGVSEKGLNKIIAAIRADPGILDIANDKSIRDASLSPLEGIERRITLRAAVGDDFEWSVAAPGPLVRRFASVSPALRRVLASAYQAHRCSPDAPWNAILYEDEITPGDPFAPCNARKTSAWYFSFLELGREALSKEDFWFPVALIRSTTIADMVGGASAILRTMIRHFSCGPESLVTAGFPVPLGGGGPVLIFARVTRYLADEASIKAGLDVKGASGIRCCPTHLNVCNIQKNRRTKVYYSHADEDATGVLVDIASTTGFVSASDADLWRAQDILLDPAGPTTVDARSRLETSLGMNTSPHGVLADRELRQRFGPASSHTVDAMHAVFASGGTGQVEIHCFVQACRRAKCLDLERVHALFMADWQYPRRSNGVKRVPVRIFDPNHWSKDTLHAQASQVIQGYHILLYAAELRVAPLDCMRAEMASLRAQCRVMDLLVQAKYTNIAPDDLDVACRVALQRFVEAYTRARAKPKHHYTLHLANQLLRDFLILLDCFVQERKHLSVKNVEKNNKTRGRKDQFERSCLARVIRDQTRSLGLGQEDNGLRGKPVPCTELAESFQATEAILAVGVRWNSVHYHQGDVIRCEGYTFLVEACALIDDRLACVVHQLRLDAPVTPNASRWRVLGDIHVVWLAGAPQLLHPRVWAREADGRILVLG